MYGAACDKEASQARDFIGSQRTRPVRAARLDPSATKSVSPQDDKGLTDR